MQEKIYGLYERFARLHHLRQRQKMAGYAEHGPFGDPSRGQGRVLAILKMQPQIATRDLSYVLGIRQQSLNELLGKLEKGGWVERLPAENDRRIMMVHLTEKGRAEALPGREDLNIFDCLTEDEQHTLAGYLDRVIEALEGRLGVDETDSSWVDWAARQGRAGAEMLDNFMTMRGFRGRGRVHRHHGPDCDCECHGPDHEGHHGHCHGSDQAEEGACTHTHTHVYTEPEDGAAPGQRFYAPPAPPPPPFRTPEPPMEPEAPEDTEDTF